MLISQKIPSVSVIMSVKNAGHCLEKSIESMLNQTLESFEFLIVDDASSDNTPKILSHYASIDNRIKIFRNNVSKGLPRNLNKLIKNSKADFIARMDADDISKNNRLETQLSFINKNKDYDICFADVDIILNSEKKLCRKWSPKSVKTCITLLPFINYFVHPTAFIRKKIFYEKGFYNENYFKAQDWELWQRYVNNGVRFGKVNEVLLNYRLSINSSSANLSSSSKHGEDYFRAIILIRNRQKLRSLKLISRIPNRLIFKYAINLIMPQKLFQILLIVNARFNKNSAAQILRRQDTID